MNRLTQKMKKRKGFTLVELIVVIVIILILAAVMVPLLMNYIGQAKMAKNIEEAKTCMTVTQGEMIHLYANNTPIPGKLTTVTTAPDKDMRGTDVGENIKNSVGGNPYMLVLGMGDYDTYKQANQLHKAYTVYFAIYWPSKDEDPIFYNGSDWVTKYPWKQNQGGANNNWFSIQGGEKMKIQFYFVAAPDQSTDTSWHTLQNYLTKHNLW